MNENMNELITVTTMLVSLILVIMVLTILITSGFWRLKNKLFGWDYVYFDGNEIIRRVRKSPSGMVYHKKKYDNAIREITSERSVKWLTCKPIKYLFDDENFIKEQDLKFKQSL